MSVLSLLAESVPDPSATHRTALLLVVDTSSTVDLSPLGAAIVTALEGLGIDPATQAHSAIVQTSEQTEGWRTADQLTDGPTEEP